MRWKARSSSPAPRCSGCATGCRLIARPPRSNALAQQADPAEQVYLVPAFVGLGAPYWDAEARGAIFGLTRNSGPAEIARAALEAVGYQTRGLLEAMRADWPAAAGTVLRVDGGMTASDVTMQFLADILGAPVDRPAVMETTALGAAYLAGYQAGVCPDPAGFSATWRLDRRFEPAMDEATRARKWTGWQAAVARVRTSPGATRSNKTLTQFLSFSLPAFMPIQSESGSHRCGD